MGTNTAVLGAVFLEMPLSGSDRVALVVVVTGLVLVAASATEDRSVHVSDAESWGLLVAAVLIGAAAVPAARLPMARSAAALGTVAGLAFGATAVAARMLPGLTEVGGILRSPATYASAGRTRSLWPLAVSSTCSPAGL